MGAEQSFQDRKEQKFLLGSLAMTPGAQAAFLENNSSPTEYLARHALGDWGEVSEDDRAENEFALDKELRIWSVYHLPLNNQKIWVITEADRSRTTILLPNEY